MCLSAAVALATVTAGCARPAPRRDLRLAPRTITHARAASGSATGVTPDQLNAHLGVGVPAGWYPVDLGDARLWVPGDVTVETEGGATVCGESAQPPLPTPGLIGVGFASASCPRHRKFAPREAGRLVSSSARPRGAPYRTINGYRVYRVAGPPSSVFEVPQLGVQLALRGGLTDRIVGTLAPSSRKVALEYATRPVPATYRTVKSYGVSVSIPARWTVTKPGAYFFGCYWPMSPSGSAELVRVDSHNNGGPGCAVIDYSAILPSDGLLLFEKSRYSPPRNQRTLGVLHHGPTTITVYAGTSAMANVSAFSPSRLFLDTVDVFVRRDGSPTPHVITLGLGRDGRVAAAVLSSLRATT